MKSYLIICVLAVVFFLTFVKRSEAFEENFETVFKLPRQRRQVGDDDLCPGDSVRIGEECMEAPGITRRQWQVILTTVGEVILEKAVEKISEAIANRNGT